MRRKCEVAKYTLHYTFDINNTINKVNDIDTAFHVSTLAHTFAWILEPEALWEIKPSLTHRSMTTDRPIIDHAYDRAKVPLLYPRFWHSDRTWRFQFEGINGSNHPTCLSVYTTSQDH